MPNQSASAPFDLVVLLSGRGSNLQAILNAIDTGELTARVVAVISNRIDAKGLEIARQYKLDTLALEASDYSDKEAYDFALLSLIDRFNPSLIALAGFMRILTPAFVQHFQGRMINIHPSLLPDFRGTNTHQRALDAGVSEHGASVHLVTEELDGGPVVAQVRIAVSPQDTEQSLADRVLSEEHKLYPTVIEWFAQGRIRAEGNQVFLDQQQLKKPRIIETVN